mmetsp:Transcript_34749/g.101927  ORF Transcript_34749/g.101927 Transcript_34749/m.101927 type:complete len:130 (-) Transcript_34749:141-530(-)
MSFTDDRSPKEPGSIWVPSAIAARSASSACSTTPAAKSTIAVAVACPAAFTTGVARDMPNSLNSCQLRRARALLELRAHAHPARGSQGCSLDPVDANVPRRHRRHFDAQVACQCLVPNSTTEDPWNLEV